LKRDMDLARRILLDIEACGECTGKGWLELKYDDWTPNEVSYHITLLHEAGLIEIQNQRHLDAANHVKPKRLTWAGHEFLDNARDETRWQKAKKIVIEKAGGLSFDLLKGVVTKLATDAIFGNTSTPP